MPQVKISEVLHCAADRWLFNGHTYVVGTQVYSCWAIGNAITEMVPSYQDQDVMLDRIESGLKELGLNIHGMYEFDEFEDDVERQGARFLWLKFVALLAEEQGV